MASNEKTSKSYLDLVNECDNFPYPQTDPGLYDARLDGLYTLLVAEEESILGFVLPRVAEVLRGLPSWTLNDEDRTLTLSAGPSEEERSAIVAATTMAMRQTGHFAVLSGWRDELYPVYGRDGKCLFKIERSASPLFGVVSYGVHMTCYKKDAATGEYSFWTPKRAMTKQTYPGMLDNTVAGGLAAGERPLEAVVREGEEEASLPADLIRERAKVVGNVSYFLIRDEKAGGETGLMQPESQYVYDMELPDDVVPKPNDTEVESFALLSTEEVKVSLRRGEFKPNCGLVMLDFFIRHGILTPENEPDYVEIIARLHRKFEFPTVKCPGSQ
ncbi:NUDIX hydrolase domain-like protein [Phyllosticta citriasiana]|uniref:NUDIX hydrolase domain-like protein n=1 Tax=Phyllosticta citriasiana TaxID=595635 RepID=A0ABR1KA02_9PEZI